ncbi:hypothetical protein ACXZ9C_11835 [Streptococcus agalactiae]
MAGRVALVGRRWSASGLCHVAGFVAASLSIVVWWVACRRRVSRRRWSSVGFVVVGFGRGAFVALVVGR